MKSWVKDIFAVILILFVVTLFLIHLFWPTPHLIVTPDFTKSDAWSFSFTTKYILSQFLHHNQLPWLENKLANGFPLIGEGQIGAFFLPNLILFRLFSPVTAYNISLLFTVACFGWGIYFWFVGEGNHRLAAFFGGITACFTGLVVPHLTHITLLQGFSILPWIMLLAYKLATKPNFLYTVLFAFFSAEQLFAGFPQAVFITQLFALSYFTYLLLRNHTYKPIMFLALAYVLSVGLAAIQLIPSREFLSQTDDPSGFSYDYASYYSFPIKNLLTVLSPFAIGNPMNGSYQAQDAIRGDIFWENNGFIGVIPILILIIGIVVYVKKKLKSTKILFIALILSASLLLMMGWHSPLYLIYSFWPFTLFRVPSRFIWIFSITLLWGSVWVLSWLLRRKRSRLDLVIWIISLTIVHLFMITSSWASYHIYGDTNAWLTAPISTQYISSAGNILTIGKDYQYENQFMKGWKDPSPYLFLRNTIDPNGNVIWGLSQNSVATGRPIRRVEIVDSLLVNEISEDSKIATVSAMGQKLLNLYRIGTVISTKPVTAPNLSQSTILTKSKDLSLYIYHNPAIVPDVYIARSIIPVQTVQQTHDAIATETFIAGETVLIEKKNIKVMHIDTHAEITIQQHTQTLWDISVKHNVTDSYLVISQLFYPGWKAYIDGKPTIIYPSNVKQEAIEVPKGNHTITFLFDSQNVKLGEIISLLSIIVVLVLVARHFVLSHDYTHSNTRRLSSDSLRNHDR